MLLPKPPTSSSLRTFWVMLAVVTGALTAGVAALSGGGALAWGMGATVALSMGIPGWLRPYAVALPYRAWNWLAILVAGALSRYVTALCLFTVTLAGRPAGATSRFDAGATSGSMWIPRASQPPGAYRSQYHDEGVIGEAGGWTAPMRSWAARTDSRWAVTLVPFLWVLRILDAAPGKERPAAAPDIYTLY